MKIGFESGVSDTVKEVCNMVEGSGKSVNDIHIYPEPSPVVFFP